MTCFWTPSEFENKIEKLWIGNRWPTFNHSFQYKVLFGPTTYQQHKYRSFSCFDEIFGVNLVSEWISFTKMYCIIWTFIGKFMNNFWGADGGDIMRNDWNLFIKMRSKKLKRFGVAWLDASLEACLDACLDADIYFRNSTDRYGLYGINFAQQWLHLNWIYPD